MNEMLFLSTAECTGQLHLLGSLQVKAKYYSALTNGKYTRISVGNCNGTILKKINASFMVNFFLGKYNIRNDTFLTHLIGSIWMKF